MAISISNRGARIGTDPVAVPAPSSAAGTPAAAPAVVDKVDVAQPSKGKAVDVGQALQQALAQAVASGQLTPAQAAKLASRLPQVLAEFSQALALLEVPRPADPQAAMALAEQQAEVKRRLFLMLLKIDSDFPGKMEASITVLLDALEKQGKLPAILQAEKAVLPQLACATIRSEAHVLLNPTYRTWDKLAEELYKKVDAAMVGADGQRLTVRDPEFWTGMEGVTGSFFRPGNNVESLGEGPRFHNAVLDLVKTSRGPLFVNYWAIYDDNSGNALKDALIEAASRGVEIYIMVDKRVSMRPHHGVEVIAALEEAAKKFPNLHVMRWFDPKEPTEGTHTKMVTDGTTVIVGGSNIGDPYTHQGGVPKDFWSDANWRITGPVVADFIEYLANRWNPVVQDGGLKLPMLDVRAFPSSPVTDPTTGSEVALVPQAPGDDQRIALSLLMACEGATDTVRIENAYFVMTPLIEAMVRRALARGVKVEVMTNSLQSVDEPLVAKPIIASAKRLLEIAEEMGRKGQARVWLKQGSTVHDKRMTLDNAAFWGGAFNLHQQSFWIQHEDVILVKSQEVTEREIAAIEADKADYVEIKNAAEIQLPPPGAADKVLMVFENQL